MVAGNIKKGVKIFNVTGTWTGPIADTPGFGDYFTATVSTAKHYRNEDFHSHYLEDKWAVIRFAGTEDQHITLCKNMYNIGFRRLWIEANFNYVTWISAPSNNYVRAFITGIKDDGSDALTKNSEEGFRISTTSTKNLWVFLNVYIRDGDRWYGTPKVEVNMPKFSPNWDNYWDTDWFQLMKWACWFSKS